MAEKAQAVEMAAEIVSAYVSNNSVTAAELPALIQQVHHALETVSVEPPAQVAAPPTPAVPVKKSVTPDYLISLEDGRKYKSLKRHLSTRGMTPDEYRSRWGLARDYPMVAANYSAQRSELAKKLGLGQGRRPAETPAPTAPARRGRPRSVPQ